jgi:hypothetical protein
MSGSANCPEVTNFNIAYNWPNISDIIANKCTAQQLQQSIDKYSCLALLAFWSSLLSASLCSISVPSENFRLFRKLTGSWVCGKFEFYVFLLLQ